MNVRVSMLYKVFAVGLLCMASTVSVAEELKVGAVSEAKILRDSAYAKAAQVKLEKEFSPKGKELDALFSQHKTNVEKYEKEAPTMSETQRSTRQRQLAEAERELQRRKRDFEEELNARRNEETQILYSRATKAIRQIAETEKYDLIFQEAAYINPRLDITDKVINLMNNTK